MHPLDTPTLPKAWSLLLAAVTGVLLGLGQPPMGIWSATIIGVGLFTWLLAGRRARDAALHGLITGLTMNTLVLHWISVLGVPVAIGLVGIMSVWLLGFGIVVALLTRIRGWALWVPAAWVGLEFATGSFPFGGFPWVRLALTALDQPLSGWFGFIGAAGVSFLVALSSNLLLQALLGRRFGSRVGALAVVAALFASGWALSLVGHEQPAETVTVGVVQGNVNRAEHGTASYARSNTANSFSETIFLLAENRATNGPALDFVVWAENATDVDPLVDGPTRAVVESAVELADVPILVGAVMEGPEPDTRQTSSLWWDPSTGAGSRYDKRNLVPFGEWIPFRDVLLPAFPILEQTGKQSIPGTEPGVLEAPTASNSDLQVGTIVCFELAWDTTSYDTITGGAQVLMSQSNTNTYAGTFEVHQQMAMNRMRALEAGREVVVSTLNGLTGLIDVDGVVHDETLEMTRANRTFTVPLRSEVSMAVALGQWPAWLLTAVAAGALVFAAATRGGRRRPGRLESATGSIGKAA